ncbi:MAG: M48 family metallopeptidase [Synergistaceae bacterium]|nr:M48 family metallopeptidase [Synergistaceae bacterium]
MRKIIPERQYANGEKFPYGGRSLELALVNKTPVPAAKVTADGGRLLVYAEEPERARQLILYWYTAETESIARLLVPAWSKKLAVRPRAVAVKYARTRWGSCSASGKIFLNSRLAMLSGDVGEYVVVHELCHLKQMNHKREFWDEVKSALPPAMELRRSLREQERVAVL